MESLLRRSVQYPNDVSVECIDMRYNCNGTEIYRFCDCLFRIAVCVDNSDKCYDQWNNTDVLTITKQTDNGNIISVINFNRYDKVVHNEKSIFAFGGFCQLVDYDCNSDYSLTIQKNLNFNSCFRIMSIAGLYGQNIRFAADNHSKAIESFNKALVDGSINDFDFDFDVLNKVN